MYNVFSFEIWILLSTVVVLIWYYIHRQWQVLKDLGVPHETPTILGLGNMKTLLENPLEFFKLHSEYKKKYGKIYGHYRGLEPRITIWDPAILKQIQIKQFWSFPDRQRNFRKLFGGEMNLALTGVSGHQWQRIRHSLTPAFSSSKLREMQDVVVQCSDYVAKTLRKAVVENNGIFDTKEIFSNFSLDVMCSAAFGVDVFAERDQGKESKVLEMSKKFFDSALYKRPLVFLCMLFATVEKIAEYFKFSLIPPDVLSYASSLITAVIKTKQSLGEKARVDILKCMLDVETNRKDVEILDKGISREEIVGNSMFMVLAGYETTAGALQFLAYNLAVHPECQESLRKEIKDAVEEYGGLTYEAIKSMKYITMCINESIRIYPPAIKNTRLCSEGVTINGLKIPKGMHINIPVFSMLRDPDYWEDPLAFKPGRMRDMNAIDPLIFQPFGAGPRICIGMRFALMEVKMLICDLLLNFRIAPSDDTPKPPLDVIFRSSMLPKVDVLHLRVSPMEE